MNKLYRLQQLANQYKPLGAESFRLFDMPDPNHVEIIFVDKFKLNIKAYDTEHLIKLIEQDLSDRVL